MRHVAEKFEGNPCKKGGHTLRYKSTGECVQCQTNKGAENQRRYRSKYPGKATLYMSMYRAKNPQLSTTQAACSRAKKSGIECDHIFLSSLKCPDVCRYLGTKIWFARSVGVRDARCIASFDRIDTSIGYLPGNVQIISKLANTMKLDATKEELVAFAKRIMLDYPESF